MTHAGLLFRARRRERETASKFNQFPINPFTASRSSSNSFSVA
jgi:hypothetical protein